MQMLVEKSNSTWFSHCKAKKMTSNLVEWLAGLPDDHDVLSLRPARSKDTERELVFHNPGDARVHSYI